MANEKKLPKHFRVCREPYLKVEAKEPQRTGLDTLNLSGSAQFSKNALDAIIIHLNHKGPFCIIDLRQEFHGYLNGSAVSWYIPKDWINRDKIPSQIAEQEKKLLDELKSQDKVSVTTIEEKGEAGEILKSTHQVFPVLTVEDEKQVSTKANANYLRLYVTDHLAPNELEVNRFIKFITSQPEDYWLHIHCAGGDGRTTTFMAMVDMLHNAKKVPFDEIINRQHLLGGIDLSHLGEKDGWKYPYAKERYEYLRRFYKYASENKDGYQTPFKTY